MFCPGQRCPCVEKKPHRIPYYHSPHRNRSQARRPSHANSFLNPLPWRNAHCGRITPLVCSLFSRTELLLSISNEKIQIQVTNSNQIEKLIVDLSIEKHEIE